MKRYALIIDDNREIGQSMARMLDLLDYEVRVSTGPRTALLSMTQRTPDVILLDLHMQGVDGVEVCRYIRRDPRFMHVPVLAISSDTQEALIARIRAAGANGFLAKPIELEALEKALAQLETPLTPPRPGGTGPVAGSSSVRS
jgi:CheY-like chemotaxis protein